MTDKIDTSPEDIERYKAKQKIDRALNTPTLALKEIRQLTAERDALSARVAELEGERVETMRSAIYLAKILHRQHYSEVTNWEPLDYPAGVISQIDNMVAGIVARAALADLQGIGE